MNLLEKFKDLKEIIDLINKVMSNEKVSKYKIYYDECYLRDSYKDIGDPKIVYLFIPNIDKILEENVSAEINDFLYDYYVSIVKDINSMGFSSLIEIGGRIK